MITMEIMMRMWPHGNSKIPGLIEGIVTTGPDVFSKYGFTTDLMVAHAMAQFSHECGAGLEVIENLHYSAQGLVRTWPSRFNTAKSVQYAGNDQQIANEVYNGRMGNRAGSNDGWDFRGRGGSQVTGRVGYTKVSQVLGKDFISNPDLVNDPNLFLECAVADFDLCSCTRFAKDDDVCGVTYHLNGGLIGLSQRENWLRLWKDALIQNEIEPYSTTWVQQSLNRLGTEPPLILDGSFGPLTISAVKVYQESHGLAVDGRVGQETLSSIDQEVSRL